MLFSDYDQSPEYVDAARWYADTRFDSEKDYSLILTEARERYKLAWSELGVLDAKAAALFTTSGALGAALVSAAKFLDMSPSNTFGPATLLGLAMVFALLQRSAINRPLPVSVRGLLDTIEREESQTGRLCASIHCFSVGGGGGGSFFGLSAMRVTLTYDDESVPLAAGIAEVNARSLPCPACPRRGVVPVSRRASARP